MINVNKARDIVERMRNGVVVTYPETQAERIMNDITRELPRDKKQQFYNLLQKYIEDLALILINGKPISKFHFIKWAKFGLATIRFIIGLLKLKNYESKRYDRKGA